MKETAQQKNTCFQNTYGLVLCGGNSNRMGADKSMLQYYNKPQRYHVYDMLLPFCEKVFIACNSEQAKSIDADYNFIEDAPTYNNIGPMAALLSAFTLHPQKNLLLIGCDYPFLKADELERLSLLCKDIPASFYNNKAVIYESMLAWYPYSCFDELKHMFEAKQFSLQQLLRKYDAIKYVPTDANCIKSVDTTEAFNEAYKLINAV
ncbi:MAG: molybdenum cofactor guanylyltransferase [Ferruginibacter sp.]|nr:molybdenum cofactor guanylyltransferase [Chitinophagaceae bacterium]